MNRILVIGVVLLACATALVPGEMRAQAEGRGVAVKKPAEPVQQVPISPEERARQLGEMEIWLRRLVGKYRTLNTGLQGPVLEHCAPVYKVIGANCPFPRPSAIARHPLVKPEQGSAECEHVAAGPGVICRLRLHNNTQLLLFGLDPDAPGIRLLWAQGINVPALGSRRDDTVTFHTGECPWTVREFRAGLPCIPILLFRAKSDGKGVEVVWQSDSGGFSGGLGMLVEWHRIDEPGR